MTQYNRQIDRADVYDAPSYKDHAAIYKTQTNDKKVPTTSPINVLFYSNRSTELL